MSQLPLETLQIDDAEDDVRDSRFYRGKTREYLELHEQVETSTNLLESLESFLSTFQRDLSAVSGQISDLQARSKEFEARLKGRRKIERPLSQLLLDLCIPPELAILILDSSVNESWIPAVEQFEYRLDTLQRRTRVKAAKDLEEVAEGLRIVAATKLRTFFLSLLQPIRASVSTNMQIIQTSVLLKFRPLFAFLQSRAPRVALEVQRAYIGAARSYYETAFRRYTRSLGYIHTRSPTKADLIGVVSAEAARLPPSEESEEDWERLSNARMDGPPVTLAYMADDKAYKQPPDALFRSLMLVLLDNATSEYSFIYNFFDDVHPPEAFEDPRSPAQAMFDDQQTDAGSVLETPRPQAPNNSVITSEHHARIWKESRDTLDLMWKQVLETALEYCRTLAMSFWEPASPPVIPLLTMMRLNETVLLEIQKRNCKPLEDFIVNLRLSMWPTFQKEMNGQVDSLKKLADGSGGGLLSKSTLKDSVIDRVARRYAAMFNAFVALSEPSEEAMLFSNLARLRQEIARIIVTHANKIKDSGQQAAYLSTSYESLLHSLTGVHSSVHPKTQTEVAFWREKEEEARRRIAVRPR